MSGPFGPAGSIQRQMEKKRLEGAGKPLPGLTPEDMRVIDKRMAEFRRQRGVVIKAQFKIEIIFGAARSRTGPFVGALVYWLSGSALSGDGDEKVYECPNDRCQHLLHPRHLDPFAVDDTGELVACPTCGGTYYRHQLVGERIAMLPDYKWATCLHRAWKRVGGDADLYLKYHRDDIRAPSKLTGRPGLGGAELLRAREERQRLHYPLKNIIIDTANGADMEGRLLAFLRA